MRSRLVFCVVLPCLAVSARAVAADETASNAARVRQDRPVAIGVALAWPWVAGHDVTVPLPSVRLGVNVSPRLALDLTAGTISYDSGGRWTLVDLGARWFFSDGHVSPYLMVRAGDFVDDADEGGDRSYPYAALGAGIEYACGCGFVAWGEVGPALVSYTGGGPRTVATGVYASAGVGYRFGLPHGQ